ncbi:protein PXR1 [Selaginella moellendorffii]|nr:protein PXR1 [Selaginella moellendorffii]|eukprot:XP_024542676.1 protein PXR1 [Selaginella moellendorffii]
MKKVSLSTCASCKGKTDEFKKIKGVEKVESDSSGLVVIGNFDLDDVRKVNSCHHGILRSIENNYEPPKKKEEKKEEKKKEEKKEEKKKGEEKKKKVVQVYTDNFNLYYN